MYELSVMVNPFVLMTLRLIKSWAEFAYVVYEPPSPEITIALPLPQIPKSKLFQAPSGVTLLIRPELRLFPPP